MQVNQIQLKFRWQLMIQAQFAMKIYNNQEIFKLFLLLIAVFWKAVETQSTGKMHLG